MVQINGLELDELEPMPQEQAEESEYRRGYADGWIQAIEHMHGLVSHRLKSHRLSRLGAYNQCYDYWQKALIDWVRGDCKEFVPPPTPPSLPVKEGEDSALKHRLLKKGEAI